MGSLSMMRELMVLSTRPPGPNTRLPCMSREVGWRISSSVSATIPFLHSAFIWDLSVKRLDSKLMLHNLVRAPTKVCGIQLRGKHV